MKGNSCFRRGATTNLRANSRGSTDWSGACGKSCFFPCSRIRKESGRGSSRVYWRNGFWRMACRCGWGCNYISLFGIRRQREFEVKEVEEQKGEEPNGGGCAIGGKNDTLAKSGSAAERGNGILRQHGDGARAAWRGEPRAASRGLWAKDAAAGAAGFRGNRGLLRRARTAGGAAGPFPSDWRVRADRREDCGAGKGIGRASTARQRDYGALTSLS